MNGHDQTALVSVIIPAGRVDVQLRDQLRAVLNQSSSHDFEVVVALNTSDPGMIEELHELLRSFDDPRLEVVVASEMRSASYARNVGVASARGEILAFCDADDEVAAGWLDSLLNEFGEGCAVGGHLDEARYAIRGQERWRPPATPGALPTFLGTPYIVSANMAVSRADFQAAGGFDTTLTRCEDIALSWQLARRGVELRYAPLAIVHYRHRRGLRSLMRQHYLYGVGMSEVLKRYGLRDSDGSRSGFLRPNSQPSPRNVVTVLRRGSVAAGRLVGLVRRRQRLSVSPTGAVGKAA